jgi:hypothetical protein
MSVRTLLSAEQRTKLFSIPTDTTSPKSQGRTAPDQAQGLRAVVQLRRADVLPDRFND